MITSTITRRPCCSRCLRPIRTCLCTWIRPTPNLLPVVLLQHPAEVNHSKGSARLLGLSLSNCVCNVGERFNPLELLGAATQHAALLYPAGPQAADRAQPALGTAALRSLVVLDGTWRQSRSLLRLNPWLLQLPRFTLSSPPPSLYCIRKPHGPEQRSTLEATCLALGELESRPAHYTPLLQAFEGWMGQSQRHGSASAGAKRR